MRRLVCCSIAFTTLSLWSGLATQGRKPQASATLAPFIGTYEDAQQRAWDRNVPLVLIAIAEADGGAVDEDIAKFRSELSSNVEFAKAAEHAVVGLAANKPHAVIAVDVDDHGVKSSKSLCSLYRTDGCTPTASKARL